MTQNKRGNVGGAIKWDISRRNAAAHVTTSAGNVAKWVIFKCVATPKKAKGENLVAVQVVESWKFYTGNIDGRNTLKLKIEDKTINVIIDSGASCNLMSQEVFHLIK